MTIGLIVIAIILASVLISFSLNYATTSQMFTTAKITPKYGFMALLIVALVLGFVFSSLFAVSNNWYFDAVVTERAALGRDVQTSAPPTSTVTASPLPSPTP